MKHCLLLSIIFLTSFCFAQNQTAVRIVAASGNVTIDGQPVVSGLISTDAKSRLVVGDKYSYVYVITSEGRNAKLSDGSYKIGSISDHIDAEARRANRPAFSLQVVVCRLPYPIVYEGLTENWKPVHDIIGDTLFLRWDKNPHYGNAKDLNDFRITNMFDDPMYEHKSQDQFVLLDLKPLFATDDHLLAQMKNNDAPSITIKKAAAAIADRVVNDLTMIKEEGAAKRVLDLAVYESDGMVLDVLFHYNKKPLDTSRNHSTLQHCQRISRIT